WNANMKHRCPYLETATLSVTALVLSVTTALSLHLDLLNAIYPSGAWVQRGEILQCVMAIYGFGITIAAAGSFIMIRYRRRTLSGYCFTWVRSVSQEAIATCKWFLTIGS